MASCSVSEIISINGLLLKKKIHDLISQNSKILGGSTTTLQGLNNNNFSDEQKSTLIVEMLKKYYNGYISKDEISLKITLITCEYLLSRFNISIDETTLLNTIKDAFKINEDESNNSESDENERHDEAVSGTITTNIDSSYQKLLNFLFSKTPSALNSIPNKFKINIIRRLFVNLDANEGKGFLARTDNISFNKNLADYQNELFDIIVNFLNNNGYSIVSDKLFTGRDFILNPNYIFIIELAYDYIQSKINSKEHDKLILEGWGNVLRENTLFRDKSSNYNKESADYYKFVEAWINLKYFDDTLKKVFGDVISLRNKEDKNSMPLTISIADEKKSKYIFGNDRSYRNSGFTDDNKRNGFTEAGRFSIALLTSLPLYSYLKWLLDKDHAKYQQENVNLIRVNTSFNKILKLVLQDKINSLSTNDNKGNLQFINAVLNLHGNPKRNITIILNCLFDSNLGILNKIKPYLTEKEIDTLFSLWKNVYNTNPEESSSIVKLENSHLGKQVIAKNGLVYSDCISELIDRVGEVQYVTVYYNNEETPTKIEFRKKFYDDNKKYELRDNINNYINGLQDRESLLNKYIVYEEENSNGNKTGRYIIDLKSFLLIIDPNDIINTNKSGKITYNIFNSTKNTVYIKINNKTELIDDYFKDVIFTSPETIDLIRDKSTYLNNLLLLFTDTLDYNFLEDNSLQILHLYKISFPEIFSQLTEGSLRSLISNQILYESKDTNIPEFVLNNSKYSGLFKNSGKIIGGEFVPENNLDDFYKIGEQYNLNVAPLNLNWITNLASSIEMFAGEEPKSVSSNFAGNKEQNGRTGHLGANLHYYMYKIAHTSNPNEAALNLLPIRNLYRGYTILSDIKSSKDKVKSIKDLNPQELLFSNIFHNFYGVYLEPSRNSQLNGNIIILPTTYSDKSTIEAFMFYAKEELGQTGKTLMELDDNDLINFLKETIGAFYTQVGLNIISDYNKIFDTNFTNLSEVNNFLQNLSSEYFNDLGIYASSIEFMLTKLANKKGVEVKRDIHYSIFQGKLGISPLLFENIEIFNNTNKLSNFLKELRNNFIDSIKNSKLLMSIAEPYVKQAINFVFGSEENGEKQGWIENGYLVVNKGNELNPLLKKYFNAYTAIAPNLRYLLTGSEIGHTLKKTSIYGSKSNGFIKVLKDAGIKAKDLGYSEEEFLSTKENIIKIKERIDNITNNKIKNKALKVYNDVINELRGIAGAEGDLSKRNTIIPATLLYVAQGALNSIPLKIKVAIVEDISAAVNTFNGISTKEDAHDGSALINPFFSILENMGLQDLAVNLDKKPIWHHYDPLTGTSTLFKYATFTMTNLRMLLSFKSDVSLYNMFKKATNFQWKHSNDDWNSNSWSNSSGSKIDLVNGRKFGFTMNENGEMELKTTIDFRKDIKLGKKLIYGLNNEYWEIFDLNYDKIKGVSTPIYYTAERKLNVAGEYNSEQLKIYHLFDKNSNHIITSDLTDEYLSKIRSGEYHTINSLFELHSVLGGIFCVENHDGEFIPSEFNNECIARYMNLVGDARRKHLTDMSGLKNIRIEDVVTQEEYNQPLKQLMISMLANPSSTKKGQSNVNPRSSWYNNEELNYCEVDSDGYGIQLDSDHEADEAELTEPTQVMTSLSQGGSLHKYARQIYQSLGRVTLLASKVELSAVKNFIDKQNNDPNNPKNINELYDTIGRIVLNNLSSQSSDMDLSDEILAEIKKEFGVNSDDHTLDKLKIAFSDPNIFSHVFPTIISVLNSKGIRRKNPGNGMIMAPAYGIYQLYKLGDQQVTFTELIKHVNLGISEIEGSRLIKRALSVENLESKVKELLETNQRTKPIFNYNAFDLGDRILIHGINKDDLFEPNIGTSIYIDSIDKFYSIQDKNWAALSSNLMLLKKYKITHEQLIKDGLDLTITTLRQDPNSNQNELLTLMTDDILLLYNYSEFQYLEDVTKGIDLRPTRIQFIENGMRHSIYDIPMIKNALKSGIEINPMLMKQLFSDLKKGYYYDNYIEQQEANFVGNGTHLIYIPDNSSKKHLILDIKYERPQTIVSNMLATRFNTNVFKTLQLVKEDVLFDKDKFKQSLEKNKHDIFDIRLLKSNGDNTFISFKKLGKKYNSKNLILNKLSLSNYRREFENENNLNTYKIIQLNSDNSDFIESEKYIEVNNVTYDGSLYIQDGKVLAEQNQYITINDKTFKKFSYLNIYDTTIREKNGKSSKHLTYNIDYEVIKEMCNLLKINEIDFISKLLNKLYISDSYITFDLNIQTISKDILKDIGNNSNELRNYVNAIIRNEDSSKLFDNILDIYSNELQTSFLKSLEVIASRIPAQTLLSFMSMDIVGFTQMKYNVAYVSHIQTFLLGSDYDIDKSYMLSYFFDDNGLFIKWSNLMDLSSIDKLNESIKLPIPNKVRIHNESEFSNFTVDNELYKINTSLSSNRKLKEETRLKKKLERLEILNQNNKEKVIVDITEELRAIINNSSISNYAELIDKIDRFAIEGFMNNKEPSKSLNTFIKYDKSLDDKVVNDILNKVRSHENYVIPEAIKEKALQNANSAKIHLIITDLDNLNAANTPINMDYVRTSASRRLGRTKVMTFWNPAVCLEMQVENQVGKKVIGIAANGEKAFFTLYYYFTECYSKILESGKYDDLKYLQFNKTFNRIQGRWNGDPTPITKTTIANLNPNITKLGDNLKFEVDQMISQLLSAATDNAKELILAKINANSDFAKIFFYGLILGFDLNDLAAFMTSSTVDLIESLAKSNMFDPNIDNLSVSNVLTILDGKYYKILNSFLNEYTLRSINNILYGNKVLVDGNEIKSLDDFCNLKAKGKINISLYEFVINTIAKYPYYINMGDERVSRFLNLKEKELANLKRLSVYIDNFTSDINKNLNTGDFQEFKELWKMSNELTTLTNVYLNTNLGLPTTMDKYLSKLIGIQNTVRSREKEIPEYIISEDKKISLKSLEGAEVNDENIKNLALLFKLVNPQYSEDYLIDVAKKVLSEKLIGTFDYHKWLIDNNYKELVIDYYNCIKGTFNIFHFLKIHPQYNANMQLLAASEVMISNINLKTNLVLDVLKQLIDESVNDFWDVKQNKKLLQSVDDIIIRLVINNFNIELDLKDNWKIYDNMWEFLEVTPEKLLFKNGFDYSNFKYIMEKYILPQLKDGKLLVTTKKDGLDVLVSIKDNLFIQNLKETIYLNRPLLALDINMSLRDNSELTNIKFANYSKAFLDLKLYKFPGFTVNGKSMTVLDLFTLYNLIVNKNQYGPSKLTALLKTSVGESDSLLYLYLLYIGEIDQRAFIVSSNEYDNMLENIKISMAPIVSKYLLSFLKKGFYKVKENGITTLYEIVDGKPKEYAMYAIDDTGEPTELTIDLKVAVMLYGCLFNVNDAKLANCGKLKSSDPESLQKALENLIKNGKLIIFSNCE